MTIAKPINEIAALLLTAVEASIFFLLYFYLIYFSLEVLRFCYMSAKHLLGICQEIQRCANTTFGIWNTRESKPHFNATQCPSQH